MSHLLASRRHANTLSACTFLGLLFVMGYSGFWWPWTILVIGAPLAVRQYLRGRTYDLILTALLFIALFLAFAINIPWNYVAPVLLTCGAITHLFREFWTPKPRYGLEEIEDAELEFEDAND